MAETLQMIASRRAAAALNQERVAPLSSCISNSSGQPKRRQRSLSSSRAQRSPAGLPLRWPAMGSGKVDAASLSNTSGLPPGPDDRRHHAADLSSRVLMVRMPQRGSACMLAWTTAPGC